MFLGMPLGAMLRRLPLFALVCVLGFMQVVTAFAQTQPPPQPGGIQFRICDHPPTCFASREARQDWARQNNCRFLEDVCEKAPGKGGDWGSGPLGVFQDAYQFGEGLLNGVKDQLGDLWHMITNMGEVLQGIGALAQAFMDDPAGTARKLGELLGQEAVDAMTKATQCGAYDLGKVIGTYVSPALALKLSTRLVRYGGKLDDAVDSMKHEYGCASFAVGTLVLTPRGLVPIERIAAGQEVASRHETSFADKAQPVLHTFNRIAPDYQLLMTEIGTFKVTGEHPLWVQGKGWTEAGKVAVDDVIAGVGGDVLVLGNRVVRQPLTVHNFSVANTPNYFIGLDGLWAHNAECKLDVIREKWKDLTSNERGFRAEWTVAHDLFDRGYTPIGKTEEFVKKNADDAHALYPDWVGKNGIDGIYKDKDGNYVIVESKSYLNGKPDNVEGCVDKLCTVDDGKTRQMSQKWIEDRLASSGLPKADIDAIKAGLKDGSVKRVYAMTDETGIKYYEVVDRETPDDPDGVRNAEVGEEWIP